MMSTKKWTMLSSLSYAASRRSAPSYSPVASLLASSNDANLGNFSVSFRTRNAWCEFPRVVINDIPFLLRR